MSSDMRSSDEDGVVPSRNDNSEDVNRTFTVAVTRLIAIVIILCAFGMFIKYLKSYLKTRNYSIFVTFPSVAPLRVGETIKVKLNFQRHTSSYENDLNSLELTPEELHTLEKSMRIKINLQDPLKINPSMIKEIGILKTFNPNNDGISLRFSVRQSGIYEFGVLCDIFHFSGSPIEFTVIAGPLCPEMTLLNIPCPEVIPIAAGKLSFIEIIPKDRYGNICDTEDIHMDNFEFADASRDGEMDPGEITSSFFKQSSSIFLKLKVDQCKVLKVCVKYNGKRIQPQYPMTMIISMSEKEIQDFDSSISSLFKTLPGSSKAKLISVESHSQTPIDVWISVNYLQITVSSYIFGFVYYPFMVFPITRNTKVQFIGWRDIVSSNTQDDEAEVVLKISDGIQDSAMLIMTAINARLFLTTYAYFKAPKLKNSKFSEKVNTMKNELSGFFGTKLRKAFPLLQLDPKQLFESSMKNAPKQDSDWKRPFVITMSTSVVAAGAGSHAGVGETKSMSISNWLNIMMETIFKDVLATQTKKSKDENKTPRQVQVNKVPVAPGSLFFKYEGSRRIHTNHSSRRSRLKWDVDEFEFAGSVLGKCVFESVINKECLDITKIRLTRSILAQFLGAPVTYKCFETDEPEFYKRHVVPLLQNNDDETNLRFVSPNDSQENLISNGNNIPVTKKNKECYLNLVANKRLKDDYKEEINAFRSGFFKVIPHGLIADFDEDELEKLISGGAKEFNLEDLRNNVTIINDKDECFNLGSYTPPDKDGITLRWLWIAISNMTSKEHGQLLKLTTGSAIIPSCGFKDLSPRFKISLRGSMNTRPKGFHQYHQLTLGRYSSFEVFEKMLLDAIHEDIDNPGSHEEQEDINDDFNVKMDTTSTTDGEVEIIDHPEGFPFSRPNPGLMSKCSVQ